MKGRIGKVRSKASLKLVSEKKRKERKVRLAEGKRYVSNEKISCSFLKKLDFLESYTYTISDHYDFHSYSFSYFLVFSSQTNFCFDPFLMHVFTCLYVFSLYV